MDAVHLWPAGQEALVRRRVIGYAALLATLVAIGIVLLQREP